jgi:hypothetical protein
MFRDPCGRIATVLLTCAACAIPCALPGCANKPGSMTVPLRFRPTARLDLGAFGGAPPKTPVYFGDVRDVRAVKDQVGENVVGESPAPIHASHQEPTDFVRLVMKDLLGRAGLKVAADRTDAGLVVLTELNQFWARETTTYAAKVRATVTVQDRGGGQLWKGTVTGVARRPGPSRGPEDFQELFSDAATEMVERLLWDASFREMLRAGAPPPAPSPVPAAG